MLSESLLEEFRPITPIEQQILRVQEQAPQLLDTHSQIDLINNQDYLSDGRLIGLCQHPRFAPSREHRHDYIELVYVCSGQMTNIVNGAHINLQAGELLFLGQNVRHAVCLTGLEDVAINFIILPEFFGTTLSLIGEESTALHSFLIDCLFGRNTGPGYLHFRVAEDEKIQNLIENLIRTLLYPNANRHKISQLTMTLLFLEILGRTETLGWDEPESRALKALQYVENHYINGSLAEAAEQLHCNIYTLSRDIRRKTGKTYTQLVQEKRLTQAGFLLRTTNWTVETIARTVGYENISYFHRLFQQFFGKSPRQYRIEKNVEATLI